MANRDTFTYYRKYLDGKWVIPQTKILLSDYKKYYDMYPEHGEINFDVFLTHFTTSWHNVDMSQDDMAFYCDNIIPKLKEEPEEDYQSCLTGLLGRDALSKIVDNNSSCFDVEKIYNICRDYENKYNSISRGCDSDLFTVDSLDLSTVDCALGASYALPELQNSLGGMVQGQLIVVGAASGVGKSAFCITQAVHTFKELNKSGSDKPILYFNSEGSPHSLYGRFLSNLYQNKTPNGYLDIVKNQEKVVGHFKNNYNTDLFMPFPIRGKDIGYIRNKIEKYSPSLIIIDLLDAMALSGSMGEARGYEQLYLDLRDLSSTSCPIIGTSQAGDSAHYYDKDLQKKLPKKWLSEKDLYFSNSGKQGAADTLIMIGMDCPHSEPRYVNVVKNKVGAGQVQIYCEIDNMHSNYKEIT